MAGGLGNITNAPVPGGTIQPPRAVPTRPLQPGPIGKKAGGRGQGRWRKQAATHPLAVPDFYSGPSSRPAAAVAGDLPPGPGSDGGPNRHMSVPPVGPGLPDAQPQNALQDHEHANLPWLKEVLIHLPLHLILWAYFDGVIEQAVILRLLLSTAVRRPPLDCPGVSVGIRCSSLFSAQCQINVQQIHGWVLAKLERYSLEGVHGRGLLLFRSIWLQMYLVEWQGV